MAKSNREYKEVFNMRCKALGRTRLDAPVTAEERTKIHAVLKILRSGTGKKFKALSKILDEGE